MGEGGGLNNSSCSGAMGEIKLLFQTKSKRKCTNLNHIDLRVSVVKIKAKRNEVIQNTKKGKSD